MPVSKQIMQLLNLVLDPGRPGRHARFEQVLGFICKWVPA